MDKNGTASRRGALDRAGTGRQQADQAQMLELHRYRSFASLEEYVLQLPHVRKTDLIQSSPGCALLLIQITSAAFSTFLKFPHCDRKFNNDIVKRRRFFTSSIVF